MKELLFDQCVDARYAMPSLLALRTGGPVTDWLAADAEDTEVLALAGRLDRILVTEDSDFGDLIFRDRLPPPAGVILLMTQLIPKHERAARFAALVPPALDTALGNFVVVGPTRYRYRPFP